MAKELERLVKYISKEDVALFIGSGFSLKAGSPSVQKIIDAINEEAGEDLTKGMEKPSLRHVSEKFINEYGGRNELILLLKKLFSFKPGDTSDQQMLVKIPHIHTIFTTNYETLLEDAYAKNERDVITSNSGCAYVTNSPVHIYKVHGDITTLNDPKSIVISDSDYNGYFTNKYFEFIWKELQNAFLKKHIVFIGYSLEDENILEIIKAVRDCIGDNMKQSFVIAPGFNQYKKDILKGNGIAYIDSKAQEVLEYVIASLKNTIAADIRNKVVCKETFDRFCKLNGHIYSTITNKGEKNVIDKFNVEDGAEREDKINMEISSKYKDVIESGLFNDRINIDGSNIYVPACKISSDELILLDYRVNDIQFFSKEDISDLFIISAYEKKSIKLKMPSIDFMEKVTSFRYKKQNSIHLDIETPICVIKISLTEEDSDNHKLCFDLEFCNTYNNNNDALKWIELLIELYSGKNLFVEEVELHPQDNHPAVKMLQKYKEYYQVIKAIERDTDILFELYNQYTKDNLLHAKYLLHYKNGTGFNTTLSKGEAITFTIDSHSKENFPIEKFQSNDFCMIRSTPLGEFELNGCKFVIPFVNSMFKRCSSKDITQLDEHSYQIKIMNEGMTYTTWCADYQPTQEGNTLHLGKKQID